MAAKLAAAGPCGYSLETMYALRRHVTTLCAIAALALLAEPAQAWVETEVRSHLATIEIDRAGRALVTQDLNLAVRGGPLPGYELSGLDLDAETLPGATVSSVVGSKTNLAATPLLLDKREDGTLRIEVDRDKGLRTGVYTFHFQYRTDLLKRDLIRREGNDVEVRWVGPRFNQGIDSARVLFRLPPGPTPPSLPDLGSSPGRIDDGDALGGVFIGNLHRLADKDELDVVRPHVSRGEPVLWRVRVSPKAFDAFANPRPAPHAEHVANATSLGAAAVQPRQRMGWWFCAALAALAYAWLVAQKWQYFSRACALRGATPCALLPLPVGLRAAVSGTLLAAAFVSSAWFDRATLGAAFLISAMLAASQFAGPRSLQLRGPGQWLPLSDEEAFGRPKTSLPGRFLDAGQWQGLLVFIAACAVFVAGAWLLARRAPYQSLLLSLGSACLLPLFFTGRGAQLPVDLATRPRRLLRILAKQLRRREVKVVPWARIPEGQSAADELRLLVQVPGAVRGLLGIEVGVEYGAGLGASAAAPFVLIRAREGSRAVEVLPREVAWTRGRKADERAAILRPRLPTQAHCEHLVLELARCLRDPERTAGPRGVAELNAGRTSSRVRVMSPAHVL